MKLRELMALDESLSKAEVVTLYKAYIPEDGKQIDLGTDGVIMYLNIKDAVQGMMNTEPESHDLFMFGRLLTVEDINKSSLLAIVKVNIPVKGQKDKELMPSDLELGYNQESGAVIIELNNFDFQIDVEEIIVNDIMVVYNENTEIKKVKHFKYESAMEFDSKKKKK